MSLPEMTVSAKSAQTTGDGKIPQTVRYYAAFIALGLVTASLGPTLPGLAENTQTRLSEISFLFTALALGLMIGSFLGGRLYDRLPGHPVMAGALIIIAVMMALIPLMPLLWLLTAVLLILGMAAGGVDVGGNTLLVWVHRRQVGPFMNALHFFFGVGAFLSPIIIAQMVLVSGGISWAYWALALLILPVSVWVLRLPSPPAQTVSDDGQAGQVDYLLVALIALFFFLFVAAELSFGGWIFTYAVALDLANETMAAYLTSTFWGALTLSRLLTIPIAIRFRPRSILWADLLGCLASVGLILLWPNSLMVWVGTFGMGFSVASIFPLTLSLAERRMPVTGQITGWFLIGAGAGSMFVPWLIGQLFESIGPQAVMLTIMVDLIAALAVFAALLLYSSRSTMTEDEG